MIHRLKTFLWLTARVASSMETLESICSLASEEHAPSKKMQMVMGKVAVRESYEFFIIYRNKYKSTDFLSLLWTRKFISKKPEMG